MRILTMILLVALSMPLAAQTRTSTPPVKKTWTVREIHDTAIIPGSDALFAIEKEAPKTIKAWQTARRDALGVTRGAKLLLAPGTSRDMGDWLKLSTALLARGTAAISAVEARDVEKVTLANGDLLEVCESCHTIYRDKGRGMPR